MSTCSGSSVDGIGVRWRGGGGIDGVGHDGSAPPPSSLIAWHGSRKNKGTGGHGGGHGGGSGGGGHGNDEDSPRLLPHPPTARPEDIGGAAAAASALPSLLRLSLRILLGTTITLYVLNQKHMLPKPLASFTSRALFWPTLPITISRRIGRWSTVVDDTVVLGGAPFGFANIPERLREEYDVRGIVNMCDEYRGPIDKYDALGMQQLWLRTVDHFEPSVEDLKEAVSFIEYHRKAGSRVYVHCRAGHGRSAAVALAWLMTTHPDEDPLELNTRLCRLRDVRRTLWKQQDIIEFRKWLRQGGSWSGSMRGRWTQGAGRMEEEKDGAKTEGGGSWRRKEKREPLPDGYFSQVWERDSGSSSTKGAIRRKVDALWSNLFGFDDAHDGSSDSDDFSSADDLSESEVAADFFK